MLPEDFAQAMLRKMLSMGRDPHEIPAGYRIRGLGMVESDESGLGPKIELCFAQNELRYSEAVKRGF